MTVIIADAVVIIQYQPAGPEWLSPLKAVVDIEDYIDPVTTGVIEHILGNGEFVEVRLAVPGPLDGDMGKAASDLSRTDDVGIVVQTPAAQVYILGSVDGIVKIRLIENRCPVISIELVCVNTICYLARAHYHLVRRFDHISRPALLDYHHAGCIIVQHGHIHERDIRALAV